MGLMNKPSYRDNWFTKLEIRDPNISWAISSDMFAWLLENIQTNDNNSQPERTAKNYDKL